MAIIYYPYFSIQTKMLNLFICSDDHEVDVLGYGGVSDDDISSVRSTGSDGGMSVNTWNQLTIVDTNV